MRGDKDFYKNLSIGLITFVMVTMVGVLGYLFVECSALSRKIYNVDEFKKTLSELVLSVSDIRKSLHLYEDQVPKKSRAMIFAEIAKTAEIAAQQNKDSIMFFLIKNRTLSPNEIWQIDSAVTLSDVAKKVQARLQEEYKMLEAKFTQDGIDTDLIQICKDVDQETFPSFTNQLRQIIDEANKLNREGWTIEMIDKIMDEKKKNWVIMIKSVWNDSFNDKIRLKN